MILTSGTVFSQNGAEKKEEKREEKKEKIEAMRIGFLTNHINLTSEEAKVFWPVYNEYNEELEKIKNDRRTGLGKIDNLSDKEVEAIVDDEIIFDQKMVDIKKKYHAKFKAVLPIKKVGKFYQAENLFKKELLKQIREKKK